MHAAAAISASGSAVAVQTGPGAKVAASSGGASATGRATQQGGVVSTHLDPTIRKGPVTATIGSGASEQSSTAN
jgi:hypothetical protein